MREAGGARTGMLQAAFQSVRAPSRVVMVSPQKIPRNAEGAQSEGSAREVEQVSAARGIIEAGAP